MSAVTPGDLETISQALEPAAVADLETFTTIVPPCMVMGGALLVTFTSFNCFTEGAGMLSLLAEGEGIVSFRCALPVAAVISIVAERRVVKSVRIRVILMMQTYYATGRLENLIHQQAHLKDQPGWSLTNRFFPGTNREGRPGIEVPPESV